MNKKTQKGILIAFIVSMALPVHASITPALMSEKNQQKVAAAEADMKAFQKSQQDACADPNEDGSMAKRQAEKMEAQKKIATKPINIESIYNMGKKNGCFAALSNFPDLSINIPSLSSVMDSLKKTLVKYAVRKTCTAVNDAFEEMLSPLKEALDKVSDRGQIDLTGMVNKEVTKNLYEIDPDLGRVNQANSEESNYDFKW